MQKGTEHQYTIECQLINSHGIHIRTAAIISEICERHDAEIVIKTALAESDGRDMMRLLMLEATCGSTLTISATGSEAQMALKELQHIINSGFADMGEV